MKFSSLKKAIAAALLLGVSAQQTHAGGFELPNFIKRWELGYTYPMVFATYKSTERVSSPNGDQVFEANIEKNVRSNFGFGGLMGTYIPITKLGSSALLAAGVNAMYNAYTWDYTHPTFQNYVTDAYGNVIGAHFDENSKSMPFTGGSVQLGLPVSLDVKFGAEASLQKHAKYTATIGVGAIPSGTITVDLDNAEYAWGVNPFAKAEIGAKAGIIWKLRFQYTMGPVTFFNGNNTFTEGNTSSTRELIGNGIASVSLVLMPFSWNFQEDGWWNWHR